MKVLLCALATVFFTAVQTNGQYTKEQQGMSISLFQFDPKELGVYHEPSKVKNVKRNHDQKIVRPSSKKNALPLALANNKKQENSSKIVPLLNANPTPSRTDAEEYLKNVKFDGSRNSTTVSLLKNVTNMITGRNSTSNATKLPKEELLFYKNKTKVDGDGSEKESSVKLIKTTPPDTDPIPIVKVVNATAPSSNSTKNATLLKGNAKNETLHGAQDIRNNTNIMKPSTSNSSVTLLKNSSSIAKNETMNKNSTTVLDTKERSEILSHFIPTIASTAVDRMDNFQSGSRKHKIHHMYPECYQCPKHSNYTECIKKATLLKCNEGLNNICFSKSHKHGDNERIMYEMGCTNHTHCKDAKAFPCRDGSKHCFTCCQFNKCNASPHHGDFETDEINLDELTKEKEDETKKSHASIVKVFPSVSVAMVMLVYALV